MKFEIFASVTIIALAASACGDDSTQKPTTEDAGTNIVDVDAGTDASTDAESSDAGLECEPPAVEVAGECVTQAVNFQATVVDDQFAELRASPYGVEAEEGEVEELNDDCFIDRSVRSQGQGDDIPGCYDLGVLSITSGASEPLIAGPDTDCYLTEPADPSAFAQAGDLLELDFEGSDDFGPVSLSGTLPETPRVEVDERADGGVTFTITNPSDEDTFISFFNRLDSEAPYASCFVSDGETLELAPEDFQTLENELAPATAVVTFTGTERVATDGLLVSLTLFSFNRDFFTF